MLSSRHQLSKVIRGVFQFKIGVKPARCQVRVKLFLSEVRTVDAGLKEQPIPPVSAPNDATHVDSNPH